MACPRSPRELERLPATWVSIESEPVKIPAFEQPATGWRALADQAGALREELTEPRDEEGPAGDASLLPDATQDYTATGATITQVIETPRPRGHRTGLPNRASPTS